MGRDGSHGTDVRSPITGISWKPAARRGGSGWQPAYSTTANGAGATFRIRDAARWLHAARNAFRISMPWIAPDAGVARTAERGGVEAAAAWVCAGRRSGSRRGDGDSPASRDFELGIAAISKFGSIDFKIGCGERRRPLGVNHQTVPCSAAGSRRFQGELRADGFRDRARGERCELQDRFKSSK